MEEKEAIEVFMHFNKEYLKRFVLSLFGTNTTDTIKFPYRDKMNSKVRSYLTKPPKNYIPKKPDDAIRIIVPLNNNTRMSIYYNYLSVRAQNILEKDFEDLFFTLYLSVSSMIHHRFGTRKELRERFLISCGIDDDVLNHDSFRKMYYRYIAKKQEQLDVYFDENGSFNLSLFYKKFF
ncbi:MAG: hypothetical protein K9J21_11855 [Bacteroidales bacterium]|nr:hypothetical protein [Bacteroidales bacterium]